MSTLSSESHLAYFDVFSRQRDAAFTIVNLNYWVRASDLQMHTGRVFYRYRDWYRNTTRWGQYNVQYAL